jgi:hypothetical protein
MSLDSNQEIPTGIVLANQETQQGERSSPREVDLPMTENEGAEKEILTAEISVPHPQIEKGSTGATEKVFGRQGG